MKIKNMETGIVHESSELYNHELTHCGIPVTGSSSDMHRMYDDNGDVDVTCKNCLRVMGPALKSVAKSAAGFECNVSNEEKPDFIPFTLNMRITTKESAQNLFSMMKDVIHEHDWSSPEQRRMAQDIRRAISTAVADID